MINHNNTTNNMNTTLTGTVKALYTANTNVSVKEILNSIQTNHSHLIVDYRKVYNTLKRISGGSSKAPKASKTEKASIVLDLTQTPEGPAVKGIVVNSGK
jgi:hypothetical protein